MRIYLLDDPSTPAAFARFAVVGTWTGGHICNCCGESTARLVEPIEIEWDDGTDHIGDFSWGGYQCVVQERVRDFLRSHGFEVGFGDVRVVRPTERAKRPRVPFPYHGPRLSWIVPAVKLFVDEQRSGIRVLSDCEVCGERRYSFKREGLVLGSAAWRGEKIFTVAQFSRSGALFITEDALQTLTKGGFSNLSPRLAGHIDG